MPRVPMITARDQLPEDQRHNYDLIAASRGQAGGPFAVLLNSPETAGRIGHLGTYLRFQGVLPAADRELAIIATAREFDCSYEWAAHVRLAREASVRQEAVDTVAHRRALTGLTEHEAVVVRYCRELFRDHRVSAAAFDAAKARFGVQGVTELTATMGYYAMLACALNAFEVTPAPDAPRLP